MDADRRQLVHHLFALTTEIAEMAHDVAVSGQGLSMPPADLIRAADTLDHLSGDLHAIARAITVAAAGEHTGSSPERLS